MEKDTITGKTEGLDLHDFTKFYAEAILETYFTYLASRNRIKKQLELDTDKTIQEIKIHENTNEIHFYFMDGTHLEYSVKDLGLTDLIP